MKKHIYISLLALASVASFTSCDDFLDAENKSAGGNDADSYFSTAEGLATYRVYAYSLLNSMFDAGYIPMLDDGSDIYWQSRGATSNYDIYNITADDSDFENYYIACYKLINAANGLLEYGSTYNVDARFLRAYGYYLLTQQFGSVPYIDSYINDATVSYPRTDLQTIYDAILSDLDYVIENAENETSTDGTVNKKAAYALAAKVALAAGWDLETSVADASEGTYTVSGTTYFTKSAAYAEQALSGVELLSSYADKWSVDNENNSETFYALQYDRDAYNTVGNASETGGHSLQNHYGGYYGSQDGNGMKYTDSREAKSLKALYMWEEQDERYAATFQSTFYNYTGTWATSGYYAYANCSEEALDTLAVVFYYAPATQSDTDFDSFITEAASNGTFRTTNYKNTTSYAYHLGKTCTIVQFNADGSVASTSESSFEDLQTKVNSIDCVKKWDDPNTAQSVTSSNSFRDIVLLHASETMLTAAEAYLMAGDEATALTYVNKVRARANASTLASFSAYDPDYNYEGGYDISLTALDVILDERGRELFGEPGRWVDLRRTKQLVRYNILFRPTNLGVTLSTMCNAKGEIKWLRPIPSTEIGSNLGISTEDQNPGY